MFYTHISLKERFRIETLLSLGYSQNAIARDLGRSKGTISEEIGKNGGRKKYTPREAHKRMRVVRKKSKRKTKKLLQNSNLAMVVESRLHRRWSPEQIVGREKILCHETIYQWVYTERKDLIPFLRRKRNKYRRKHGTKERERMREEAKKRRIDTRPSEVEQRSELGHWEGDTIVGSERTTGIATHVERASGYLFADLLLKKNAQTVCEKTAKRFRFVKKKFRKTVTYDNGNEFSFFERIERDTKMTVYFAYPYHSWERGTNENTNGLLREFFPKKTPFATLKQSDVARAVHLLNHRPRKRLGYLTPYEVFVLGVRVQGRM